MKKIIFSVFMIIAISFFGFKFYFLQKIKSVVKIGEQGQFSSSSHLTLNKIKESETNSINTTFFKAKTYVEFTENDIDMPLGVDNLYSFAWEEEENYKIVTIVDKSKQSGILGSFRENGSIREINQFLGKTLKSDYELLSFCFSLNHEDINLFLSFDELKVYPFCFVTRGIYLYHKGGIYEYQLPEGINVFQIGSSEYGDVTLHFHNNSKEIFSVSFTNVEQKEIDLFLNSIEFIDETSL